MTKPILCLDFDGTMHNYASGWQGPEIVADAPVAGLFEFLEKAIQVFDVRVFSSRFAASIGVRAAIDWFIDHAKSYYEGDSVKAVELLGKIQFTAFKPAAYVILDDRALTFNGVWPDVQSLVDFQPWHKKGVWKE